MANQSESKTELKIKKIKTKLEKIVLVIGTTGTGKSTIINMLYNNSSCKDGLLKPCPTSSSSITVTQNNYWHLNAETLSLYGDTVGLGDPNQSSEEIAQSLNNLIMATLGGVHCIIVVMKYGRQGKEARENLKIITKIFNKGLIKKCILVVTHYTGDFNVETGVIDEEVINKWIGNDNEMKDFINMINEKVILTHLSSSSDHDIERYRRLREQTLVKLKNVIDRSTDLLNTSLNLQSLLELFGKALLPSSAAIGAIGVFGAVGKAAVGTTAENAKQELTRSIVGTVFQLLANTATEGSLQLAPALGFGAVTLALAALAQSQLKAQGQGAGTSKKIRDLINYISGNVDMEVRAGECSVCKSEIFLTELAQTKCNHIFHIKCISEEYKKNGDKCPKKNCTEKITEVVQPDFFELSQKKNIFRQNINFT